MKTKIFVLLIMAAFASQKYENGENEKIENKITETPIIVKIEESEYVKTKVTSDYIGVTRDGKNWRVCRRSKSEKKILSNGSYANEETAAHASDTLARNLMEKGEQGHKLNFADDHIEVHPEKTVTCTSEYIGVTYNKRDSKWRAERWSKSEKKMISNSYYDNEETAAHASDTLARKLMKNGEQGHKLNFADDHTEVHPEKYQKKKRKRQDNFQNN